MRKQQTAGSLPRIVRCFLCRGVEALDLSRTQPTAHGLSLWPHRTVCYATMDLMKGANRALMHKLSSGKGTEAFAQGPGEWAKNMMKKMGWTEGKGIGKKEDGIVKHIKVDKKDNNDGLGAVDIDVLNNPQCSIEHWAQTFDSVKVNIRCGSSDEDDDSDSSSDSSDSEQMVSTTGANATTNSIYNELYIACKGRRIGQRNHGVQRGKWMRSEGTDKPANSPAQKASPAATTANKSTEKTKRKKKQKERKSKSKTANDLEDSTTIDQQHKRKVPETENAARIEKTKRKRHKAEKKSKKKKKKTKKQKKRALKEL